MVVVGIVCMGSMENNNWWDGYVGAAHCRATGLSGNDNDRYLHTIK